MTQFLKRNRMALILGAGITIVVVNLVYLLGPIGKDVVGSDSSRNRVSNGSAAKSSLFPPLDGQTVSEFVSITFPMAISRIHENYRGYDRFVIFGGQDYTIGYVYEVQDDLRCPVCNNVRLLVAVDAAGEVREIQALEPLELSGEPMAAAEVTRFFKQFTSDHNKATNGQLSFVLGEHVDGITGATKSSIHIVDALNRLLFIHRS